MIKVFGSLNKLGKTVVILWIFSFVLSFTVGFPGPGDFRQLIIRGSGQCFAERGNVNPSFCFYSQNKVIRYLQVALDDFLLSLAALIVIVLVGTNYNKSAQKRSSK